MTPFRASLKEIWHSLSWLDVVSTVATAAGLILAFLNASGGVFSFLKYLAVLAGIYLFIRFLGWWRNRLLWSLRNRLIVGYLFIALVPILLIVTLVFLVGRILYSQLGAYLLYEDIHRRVEMIADISAHIAIAHQTLPAAITQGESERILAAQSHAVHDSELPGLTIVFSSDPTLLRKATPSGKRSFAGLLQEGDSLSLISLRAIPDRKGERIVALRVPVTQEFLATVAPDLGAIQLNLMERYTGGGQQGVIYSSGETQYKVAGRIVARNRTLQSAMFWIDTPVNGVSRLDSVFVAKDGRVEIPRAVADLYRGTQYVQAGDFSHRVQIQHRDQLGELGESFNQMTSSISGLIEEQNKRQRLENEISIAREVQNQLFPRTLPSVPGVEIEAICKAARSVSGDYYDFIQLSPTHVALAIADISGKGISAALLMASLQAALRSQLLTEGSDRLSTAELVARLNKHLVRNTGDDRFATFFIAVYDSVTRTLRYTNAGHLPAFLICHGSSKLLEEGAMEIGPDALVIGYSDGLVEPENVYGEEFGIRRLKEAAIRLQGAAPLMVAESLMAAAEEWAGTPEQMDDMTVIVARLR